MFAVKFEVLHDGKLIKKLLKTPSHFTKKAGFLFSIRFLK
jgi:hypothetical protein